MSFKVISLRSHHLVCMQSFIGKGYSVDFINNFSKIMRFLTSNPDDDIIMITNKCDDICKRCPNIMNNNKCKDEEYTLQLDSVYYKVLNLSTVQYYSWNRIKYLVSMNLKSNTFKNTCNACQWFDICSKKLAGAPGFEPGNDGAKDRCLTAWPCPNKSMLS